MKLYLCCPLLNKECKKDNCYIHGGCCRLTNNKQYSQQELIDRIDKAIESLNYYIEGMNKSLEIWNKVREIEKIKNDTLLQMLEREKQNYIDVLDILKGSDTNVKN